MSATKFPCHSALLPLLITSLHQLWQKILHTLSLPPVPGSLNRLAGLRGPWGPVSRAQQRAAAMRMRVVWRHMRREGSPPICCLADSACCPGAVHNTCCLDPRPLNCRAGGGAQCLAAARAIHVSLNGEQVGGSTRQVVLAFMQHQHTGWEGRPGAQSSELGYLSGCQ